MFNLSHNKFISPNFPRAEVVIANRDIKNVVAMEQEREEETRLKKGPKKQQCAQQQLKEGCKTGPGLRGRKEEEWG